MAAKKAKTKSKKKIKQPKLTALEVIRIECKVSDDFRQHEITQHLLQDVGNVFWKYGYDAKAIESIFRTTIPAIWLFTKEW